MIDDLPIYQHHSDFVFQLTDEQYIEIETIFKKMDSELSSDYEFKYDLLRNYVIELIHTGQKLKPMEPHLATTNAASRISSLFIELLERQFPIENDSQKIQLKAPIEFAKTLNLPLHYVEDLTLHKRVTLIFKDGKIVKYFYPVFPPDKNINEVIEWLKAN